MLFRVQMLTAVRPSTRGLAAIMRTSVYLPRVIPYYLSLRIHRKQVQVACIIQQSLNSRPVKTQNVLFCIFDSFTPPNHLSLMLFDNFFKGILHCSRLWRILNMIECVLLIMVLLRCSFSFCLHECVFYEKERMVSIELPAVCQHCTE